MTKLYKLSCVLLAVLTLAGCSLIPFEDPEEQRLKAEAAATEAVIELPNPREALADDRTYYRELRNQTGTLLAVYSAVMPRFSQTGEHGPVFEEINSHYDIEFGTCAAECESFFAMVQRHHGEEWDLLETVGGVFRTTYQYRLLDTPEKYICIQKTYTYQTDAGSTQTRYYPDVFLAENGWRLSFDGLFGHNAADAGALVMAGIRRWCETNAVAHEKLDSLTAADFTEFYAMDDGDLVFYSLPFMLSTNDGTGYVIPLALSGFEDLMIE